MPETIFEKLCTRCNETKPATLEFFGIRTSKKTGKQRWDSWCKDCYRLNTHRHNTKDPEAKKRRDREYRKSLGPLCWQRRKAALARLSLSEQARRKIIARRHNEMLKREALAHYGGEFCQCCGETELLMLTLDHINNDGAAHRRAMTGDSKRMPANSHLWAKRQGWPPIYKTMCINCNFARHWTPDHKCPHEIERETLWQSFLDLAAMKVAA